MMEFQYVLTQDSLKFTVTNQYTLQLSWLTPYWKDLQWISAALHPQLPAKDLRHDADPKTLDSYVLRYTNNKGEAAMERTGVHHLVHAWTQKGHPKGVRYEFCFNL